MLSVAHLSHALTDRIRLHIPGRKGDAAYFAALEKALAAHKQVTHVETNPLTSSVLIYHKADQAALLRFAQDQQLFQLQPEFPAQQQVLAAAEAQLDQADRTLRRLTQGVFDLKELLFVGLIGAAVIQTFRGRFLGSATALLSYAATILMLRRGQYPMK